MRKRMAGLLGAASIATTAVIAGVAATGVTSSAAPSASTVRTSAANVSPAGDVSIASTRGGRISRAEVIRRAKYWYRHRASIRYSWTSYHRDPDSASHTYRQDCSGFVSMALHLRTSLSTVTLPGVGTKISRKSMRPGDFTGVLGPGTGGAAGHVRLFEKWANAAHTKYWAYDFGSYPVKHQVYSLSGDRPRGGIPYTAYRYKKIY